MLKFTFDNHYNLFLKLFIINLIFIFYLIYLAKVWSYFLTLGSAETLSLSAASKGHPSRTTLASPPTKATSWSRSCSARSAHVRQLPARCWPPLASRRDSRFLSPAFTAGIFSVSLAEIRKNYIYLHVYKS